jgi:hypothetical protein
VIRIAITGGAERSSLHWTPLMENLVCLYKSKELRCTSSEPVVESLTEYSEEE